MATDLGHNFHRGVCFGDVTEAGGPGFLVLHGRMELARRPRRVRGMKLCTYRKGLMQEQEIAYSQVW